VSRNAIVDAVLALLTSTGAFNTSGRRLLAWTKVDSQPAIFVRHVGDHYGSRGSGMPPKVVMECEAWIYSNAGKDADAAPSAALADLLDTVEALLKPATGHPSRAQTLGGAVAHAWIEGKIEIHPGDLDGQAIAVVPISILVPVLN
jgi:hypothetical protein